MTPLEEYLFKNDYSEPYVDIKKNKIIFYESDNNCVEKKWKICTVSRHGKSYRLKDFNIKVFEPVKQNNFFTNEIFILKDEFRVNYDIYINSKFENVQYFENFTKKKTEIFSLWRLFVSCFEYHLIDIVNFNCLTKSLFEKNEFKRNKLILDCIAQIKQKEKNLFSIWDKHFSILSKNNSSSKWPI